ncbi:hypothetical protein ALC60_07218 [Trachymyrmex zeteki]|uniref:Uncharacterized protein n=1 Tax=Mycetomoellerius zeteki TaxID=64791 RepID=A0A151X108_9HYME|nr:hypothetical protein ALC60_07218 [Trachymyrmex zeteki]
MVVTISLEDFLTCPSPFSSAVKSDLSLFSFMHSLFEASKSLPKAILKFALALIFVSKPLNGLPTLSEEIALFSMLCRSCEFSFEVDDDSAVFLLAESSLFALADLFVASRTFNFISFSLVLLVSIFTNKFSLLCLSILSTRDTASNSEMSLSRLIVLSVRSRSDFFI